jgi:N-acetylmuramoyl-L-alanine amidase
MSLVILDQQHHGKPGKDDHGASFGSLVETDLTAGYIAAAQSALEAAGVEVLVLRWGWYSERHRYARELAKAVPAKVVYASAHVNAGGGSYGLVCHDYRSKEGARLATSVSGELGKLVETVRTEAASGGTWANAYNTIKGIYEGPGNLSAICYEPGFIDSDMNKHLWLADGLVRVGDALAAGILKYLEP